MDEIWLAIAMLFLVLIFAFMMAVTQGWIDIAKPQVVIGAAAIGIKGMRKAG